MFEVLKLHPDAILPTVAHAGEDLGYDLYALEDTLLISGAGTLVRTGIAARFSLQSDGTRKFGFTIEDRSSMAVKGLRKSAGIIDAGYVGEIKVLLTPGIFAEYIKKGEKIAQMLPTEVFTAESIVEVFKFSQTARGEGGFGSTGV